MNGIIVLDKPRDFTSFDAVAVVRGLSREKKIGHTGTLDPMATGVLPLLLGKSTKALDLLPHTEKRYVASFLLGQRRDTGDITGKVLEKDPCPVTRKRLEEALPRFRGEITQVPPMYSAVSVGGKRLYELARKGLEVDRPPRPVTISELKLISYDEITRAGKLEIACSKGTYVRTLIEDVAKAAGTMGTMTELRRTMACGFSEADSISLDRLKQLKEQDELETVLRPVESLFRPYPAVTISPAQSVRFQNGGALDLCRLRGLKDIKDGARFRVRDPEGTFLGLGAVDGEKGVLKVLKGFR